MDRYDNLTSVCGRYSLRRGAEQVDLRPCFTSRDTLLMAKPTLWNPDKPHLYLALKIASDQVVDQIGFRTIATRDSKILLNGKKVFLEGICTHEEALSRQVVLLQRRTTRFVCNGPRN